MRAGHWKKLYSRKNLVYYVKGQRILVRTQLEEKKKKELEPRSARCKKMQEEIEAQRFVLADADTGRYDDALVQVFHKRNLRAQMLLGPAGSAMARHLPIQMFRD